MKKILYTIELGVVSVDEVFVSATNDNLFNLMRLVLQSMAFKFNDHTWRVTVILLYCSYPTGDAFLSSLLNTIETLALVTPACPCLYTNSWRLFTRTYK
jgi:hypothetical protein